mmetsp:Transcript_13159/g.15064  ORF Transcript_13159/g.15064 Transcript_13159/m.15064 type:complete len:321 (+) Transcript_13159:91-1053(+)|eukprot:CAMPEP_0184025100 /NCGR_PEP_ID=MMETSP0954-20121128/12559_1 /TAXON_ID=627963 /ORGANISM="Aplanochytrium sp, Strain PBS07" /LENGTH=320 /DNA_ID=CAMNT_0026308719 /DNA_START=61 /DNA_END=1023 /DNA_ORIENTATION=-
MAASLENASLVDLVRALLVKLSPTAAKLLVATILLLLAKKYMAKKKSCKGKLVLITGAAGGLGRETALCFAKKGARLALWDVNLDGLEETATIVKEKTGADVKVYKVNLVNREDIYAAAKQVKSAQGTVWCLVNNAGILSGTELLETPDRRIELLFAVNVMAHFWTTKAFLGDMIEKNDGHIVGISSFAGHVANPRMVDYCSSKFAARGFMEALHTELHATGKTGVNTTVVFPSHINTDLFKGFNVGMAMSPAYVASQVVGAVEDNQHSLVLPRILGIAIFWQGVMPTQLWDFCTSLSYGSMNKWDGSQANKVFKAMGDK